MVEEEDDKKVAPLGVKIITFLSFALIVYSLAYPWILSMTNDVFFQLFQFFLGDSMIAGNLALTLFLMILPGSILFFFITLEFAKGKNWARIFLIVITILGFLSNLGNLLSFKGALFFLIYGGIAAYLLFSKNAKEYFGKKKNKDSREENEREE